MAPLDPFGENMHTDSMMPGWRKSSFCNGATGCVEVAPMVDGNVALRDSKEDGGPVLIFTPEEWETFLKGAQNAEFDLPNLTLSR